MLEFYGEVVAVSDFERAWLGIAGIDRKVLGATANIR